MSYLAPTDPFFTGFANMVYVGKNTMRGLSATVANDPAWCRVGCFSLVELDLVTGNSKVLNLIPFRVINFIDLFNPTFNVLDRLRWTTATFTIQRLTVSGCKCSTTWGRKTRRAVRLEKICVCSTSMLAQESYAVQCIRLIGLLIITVQSATATKYWHSLRAQRVCVTRAGATTSSSGLSISTPRLPQSRLAWRKIPSFMWVRMQYISTDLNIFNRKLLGAAVSRLTLHCWRRLRVMI